MLQAKYTPSYPGIVNIELEIAQTATVHLAEQVALLIDLPLPLQPFTTPRLRLAVAELHRRALAVKSEAA